MEKRKDYIVTLAPESRAKKGTDFRHENVPSGCEKCKLFQICMKNLEVGCTYRIIEVQENVRHRCPRFNTDLLVVKVKEKPFLVTFPAGRAFPGILIRYHPTPCKETGCRYHENCNPPPDVLKAGMPVKILKVVKKLKDECVAGHDLGLFQISREKME